MFNVATIIINHDQVENKWKKYTDRNDKVGALICLCLEGTLPRDLLHNK